MFLTLKFFSCFLIINYSNFIIFLQILERFNRNYFTNPIIFLIENCIIPIILVFTYFFHLKYLHFPRFNFTSFILKVSFLHYF